LNKKIPLGEILKPHGIKGELKILFYNEDSKSLQKDQKVFLESPQKNIIEYKIERIFYSFRKNRIKFFDINTINEADDLRGYVVNVKKLNPIFSK
jgi:16S rRNA processing protein RimM